MNSRTGSSIHGLYELLVETELVHYYSAIKNELKVTSVNKLRYVQDEELANIGFSKLEQRRLHRYFQKHLPPTYINKIKSKILSKSKEECDRTSTNLSGLNINKISSPISLSTDRVIAIDNIEIIKDIGVGMFGVVKQGIWYNEHDVKIQVAVKCINKKMIRNSSAEFLKEMNIQYTLNNEHIVHLYGVVLDSQHLMMVTELAPQMGLLECLREPVFQQRLPVNTLCDFSLQICDAMKYLESRNLIHQNLGAHNVLIFGKNKVKVSDFGLSRAIGLEKVFFQTSSNGSCRQVIAWYPPETIKSWTFTSASDIWAFGVTLWEIFSYGKEPWAELTWDQIVEAIDAPNFQRLKQPSHCPKDYFLLMLNCWKQEPTDRPSFAELYLRLSMSKVDQVQVVKGPTEPLSEKASEVWLKYKLEDLITVLDKSPLPNHLNVWKGVLNNGELGLFNLGDTVPFHSRVLPTRHSSLSKADGRSGMRRRFTPDMISRPQGDLKHTVHVGVDGSFFGDISFLGSKYHQLSQQISKLSETTTNLELAQTKTVSKLVGTSDSSSKTQDVFYDTFIEDNLTFEALDLGPPLMEEVFKALGCTNTEGLFDCNLSIEAQSDYSFDQEKNKQSINTEGFFSDVHKLQSPLITEEKCVVEDVTERECRIDNVFVNDQQQEPNIRTDLIADEETFQSAIVIANKLTQENKFGNQSTDEDSVLQESHKLPSSFNKSMLRGTPMIEKILLSSEIESIPNIQSFLQDNADNLYTSCIENGQGLKTKGLYFTPIPVSEPEVSQLQVSIDYQHSIEAFKNNQEHYISTQNKSKDNQVISRPSLLQSKHSSDIEDSSESNPLRMLRKGRLVQPKVRGNKHSIPLSNKGTVVCPSTVKPIGNGQNDKKYIPSESPPLPSSENSLSSLSSHMSVTLENDIRQEPIPIKETSAKTQDFWFGDCDENFLSNAELTFNSLDDHLLSFPRSQIDSSHFSRQQQQRYPSTLTSEDYEKIKSTILSKQSHPSSLNVSNSGSFSNWKAISEGKINSVTSYEGKVSSKDELTVARSDPLRISRMQEGLIKETDSDEVRIIQKVLAENNVTPEECVIALKETDWDVHKAVKVLQLQCTVNIHNLEVEDFKQTLIHCNWNVQHAADFLFARYIAGEDTTEL